MTQTLDSADDGMHTGWSIHPSLWFDSLCLIPLLAGMDFYTSRHPEDSLVWRAKFEATADQGVHDALAFLKAQIADDAGKPLPAFLALWCSPAAPTASADRSYRKDSRAELNSLIDAVDHPNLLSQLMKECSAHWTAADEVLFTGIRPSLGAVLRWMRDAKLPEWWRKNVETSLENRCRELDVELAAYDLVPLIEQRTGIDLATSTVEVCLLRWAAPHAIRVTGVRFLTDVRYPATIVLNNSVHELLHPSWPDRHPLSALLADLHSDRFLTEVFDNRPHEAGYNSWKAYAEEDAAQALDQWLNEHIGLAKDPRDRWREADGGMHVLAMLLFDVLQRGGFGSTDETFADFVSRALTEKTLWPENLEERYTELTAV